MKKNFLFVGLVFCLNAFSQIPADSLVGYWPFRGNANDESGKGNNGTVYGANLTTDRFGNDSSAYYFDGVADYIEVPDSSSLDFNGNGAISLWVKKTGNIGTLLWKRIYSGSLGWTIYFGFPDTVIAYTNDNAVWVRSDSIPENMWQHIVLTSCDGVMKLYIDGNLNDSMTNLAGFQATDVPLLIGTDVNSNYFKGSIDDIRIYDRCLSQAEVILLYNEPNTTSITDIAANYFKISPNPSSGSFTVSVDANHGMVTQIKIYDLIGQLIQAEAPIKVSGSYTEQINLSNVAKGVYILQIQSGEGILNRKIEVD